MVQYIIMIKLMKVDGKIFYLPEGELHSSGVHAVLGKNVHILGPDISEIKSIDGYYYLPALPDDLVYYITENKIKNVQKSSCFLGPLLRRIFYGNRVYTDVE